MNLIIDTTLLSRLTILLISFVGSLTEPCLKNIVAHVGGRVTFHFTCPKDITCRSDGIDWMLTKNDADSGYLYRKNRTSRNDIVVSVSNDGFSSNLTISNISPLLAGIYTTKINNNVVCSAVLVVTDIQNCGGNAVGTERQSALLTCSIRYVGEFSPKLEWSDVGRCDNLSIYKEAGTTWSTVSCDVTLPVGKRQYACRVLAPDSDQVRKSTSGKESIQGLVNDCEVYENACVVDTKITHGNVDDSSDDQNVSGLDNATALPTSGHRNYHVHIIVACILSCLAVGVVSVFLCCAWHQKRGLGATGRFCNGAKFERCPDD